MFTAQTYGQPSGHYMLVFCGLHKFPQAKYHQSKHKYGQATILFLKQDIEKILIIKVDI